MGITNTTLTIRNPRNPKKFYTGEFLVDTGAQYTVVPQAIWKRLEIEPDRKQKFSLADGAIIERPIGSAFVEFQGIKSASPIVLGHKTTVSSWASSLWKPSVFPSILSRESSIMRNLCSIVEDRSNRTNLSFP